MRFYLTTALCVLPVVVLGQSELSGVPISGALKPGVGNSTAQAVSEAAGRNPNATDSVTFTRNYDNTAEQWTWRINVTEIAVPNSIYALGVQGANYSENYRVVNTQWQLQWPGENNQTLQDFLAQREQTMYVNSIAWNYPSNITSKYKDSDAGICDSVLGASCRASLENAATDTTLDISSLSGCDDTLNMPSVGNNAGTGFQIAGDNSSNAGFYSTDTLYYQTTGAYTAGNETTFEEAETALQILILGFKTSAQEMSAGDVQATVLCRIVDANVDVDTGAAVRWQQPATALWALVLAGIWFAWA